MKKKYFLVAVTWSIFQIMMFAESGKGTSGPITTFGKAGLSGGSNLGYYRGGAFQLNVTFNKIAQDFPFLIRLGAGFTRLEPGNAADARRIFINNATNGVPEKKGRVWDYRMDIMLPYTLFEHKHSFLTLGPRYTSFTGNFKFVGGNEDFDVTSTQWGIGTGLESHFRMNAQLDLVIGAGLDYYFPSKLQGHDTAYSPDDENVNPRRDNQNDDVLFTYKDANKAIRQPLFMPRIMIGVNYHFK